MRQLLFYAVLSAAFLTSCDADDAGRGVAEQPGGLDVSRTPPGARHADPAPDPAAVVAESFSLEELQVGVPRDFDEARSRVEAIANEQTTVGRARQAELAIQHVSLFLGEAGKSGALGERKEEFVTEVESFQSIMKAYARGEDGAQHREQAIDSLNRIEQIVSGDAG
jgi:hypothetical protein